MAEPKPESWYKKSRLGTRALIAVVLGPVVLGSAYFGEGYFLAVMIIVVLTSAVEYYLLAWAKGARPQMAVGLLGAAAVLGACYSGSVRLAFASIVFLTVLAATVEVFRGPEGSLVNLASTLFGPLYIAGLLGHLLLIRRLPLEVGLPYRDAGTWIVGLILVVWICDTAAFFFGSVIGRRKLAAKVSPNKTWEGAVAGLIFALLSAWILGLVFITGLETVDVLVLGGIVGTFGQISDLSESLLKRDVGVKDSSRLIPGHGGMLDRFDSFILIAPALFWYLRLVAFG